MIVLMIEGHMCSAEYDSRLWHEFFAWGLVNQYYAEIHCNEYTTREQDLIFDRTLVRTSSGRQRGGMCDAFVVAKCHYIDRP